ncbi:MAG: MBL fold metallo-hydrolase, partial [Deltaproteobacteria bacterium]|nr:MBL fold metallo-hydrolase [Deltaproteobacteria bacterium]
MLKNTIPKNLNTEVSPETIPQASDHLTVCILASGSKGNAILVADHNTRVLFDAGLSGIEIERRCISKGFHPEQLDAIVVSHEHADHIQGVGVLARRFGLPVHISKRTSRTA